MVVQPTLDPGELRLHVGLEAEEDQPALAAGAFGRVVQPLAEDARTAVEARVRQPGVRVRGDDQATALVDGGEVQVVGLDAPGERGTDAQVTADRALLLVTGELVPGGQVHPDTPDDEGGAAGEPVRDVGPDGGSEAGVVRMQVRGAVDLPEEVPARGGSVLGVQPPPRTDLLPPDLGEGLGIEQQPAQHVHHGGVVGRTHHQQQVPAGPPALQAVVPHRGYADQPVGAVLGQTDLVEEAESPADGDGEVGVLLGQVRRRVTRSGAPLGGGHDVAGPQPHQPTERLRVEVSTQVECDQAGAARSGGGDPGLVVPVGADRSGQHSVRPRLLIRGRTGERGSPAAAHEQAEATGPGVPEEPAARRSGWCGHRLTWTKTGTRPSPPSRRPCRPRRRATRGSAPPPR